MDRNDIILSIVTVSFNSIETIEETINSIIKQKNKNVEYIVIDGDSTDGTIEIIKKYQDKIDKIIVEKDRGISDAFNKGVLNASGKIVGIINSDDVLVDGAIDFLFTVIDDETDVYRSQIYKWDSESNKKTLIEPSMDLVPHGQKIVIAHPGTFITKRAYEKYGYYDLNCKNAMDSDLLIRLAINGVKMKYVPYPMAYFRLGGVTTKKLTLKGFKKRLDESMYIAKKNNVPLHIRLINGTKMCLKYGFDSIKIS